MQIFDSFNTCKVWHRCAVTNKNSIHSLHDNDNKIEVQAFSSRTFICKHFSTGDQKPFHIMSFVVCAKHSLASIAGNDYVDRSDRNIFIAVFASATISKSYHCFAVWS